MDFLGVGPWEILLVFIIALIVVGPGKIPEIARTLSRIVRATRRITADFTTAVVREMDTPEKGENQPRTNQKKSVQTGPSPSAISKPSPQKRSNQPENREERPPEDE